MKNYSEILATITYIARTVKPRLKDYRYYLEFGRITGQSLRFRVKGKNPWKDGTHGMTNHIETLYQFFEYEDINKNLLQYSIQLIDRTLNSIFKSENEKLINLYDTALSEPNFLYIMLQISVRLLGQDLMSKDIVLVNSTLQYVLSAIETKTRQMAEMFKEAQKAGNKTLAINSYYDMLDEFLKDFLERNHNITGQQAFEIGNEMSIQKDVGEEIIFTSLGYIFGEIQDSYRRKLPLFGQELITLK